MNPEQAEMQKMETMKRILLKKILSKEAAERLGRIRLVKPDTANQLELYLVQIYQEGKLKDMITDDQLKMILEQVSSKPKFRLLR